MAAPPASEAVAVSQYQSDRLQLSLSLQLLGVDPASYQETFASRRALEPKHLVSRLPSSCQLLCTSLRTRSIWHCSGGANSVPENPLPSCQCSDRAIRRDGLLGGSIK